MALRRWRCRTAGTEEGERSAGRQWTVASQRLKQETEVQRERKMLLEKCECINSSFNLYCYGSNSQCVKVSDHCCHPVAMERARNMKLGLITGNDVQALTKKRELSRSDGDAVVEAQIPNVTFWMHAPHTIRQTEWKLDGSPAPCTLKETSFLLQPFNCQ